MDIAGHIFWRRFAIVLIASLIVGFTVNFYYGWIYGLLSYVFVQWFSIPVLIRMTMND